jgi:phospholipid-binding lipoprotein MlaA
LKTSSRTSVSWLGLAIVAAASFALAGCSALTGPTAVQERDHPITAADMETALSAPLESRESDPAQGIDYDPWEGFNEQTFWFNHDVLDYYALKPAATAWNWAVPTPVSQGLTNAFDNLEAPKRLVNNVLQGRIFGAQREMTRFTLNSTVGLLGTIDVATRLGVEKSNADTGQTLGAYGVGPGPYLVVPFLPPLTVRDGVGYAVDSLLDPIGYLAPFAANVARSAVKTVNDRSANLELYQDVEESTLDLYSAVRNGYLQRRQQSVRDAIRDRELERESGMDISERTPLNSNTVARSESENGVGQ